MAYKVYVLPMPHCNKLLDDPNWVELDGIVYETKDEADKEALDAYRRPDINGAFVKEVEA